jgi:hypothetical protein
VKRQARLQALMERFGCPAISLSEPLEDGLEQRGLEGVVSKRQGAPYRSGKCQDWRKVKTLAWREANRERWRPPQMNEAGDPGERSTDLHLIWTAERNEC